jgi:hypothetical protein
MKTSVIVSTPRGNQLMETVLPKGPLRTHREPGEKRNYRGILLPSVPMYTDLIAIMA